MISLIAVMSRTTQKGPIVTYLPVGDTPGIC